MRTLRTTTHIGPGGALNLSLPIVPDMAGEDVDVLVVLSPIAGNGSSLPQAADEDNVEGEGSVDSAFGRWQGDAPLGPRLNSTERRLRLNKAIGSIDDPTFVRPPQGEYEKREPLD